MKVVYKCASDIILQLENENISELMEIFKFKPTLKINSIVYELMEFEIVYHQLEKEFVKALVIKLRKFEYQPK